MKAVRVGKNGAVSVVEAPRPVIGPGEALMRTRVAGICGSDLIEWYAGKKAGQIIGHEVAGEIVEVGAGVRTFAAGGRIAPHHHAPCLECEECRAGRFVHCAAWRSSRLDPGGMAQFVRIPAGNLARDTLKIPAGMSYEEASFIEPLATVVKAFRRAKFQSGQSVLVIGLGTVGHLAARLARAGGASRIAGADRVAFRIAKAKESGSVETFDVDRETIADGARRLTGGRGFDFVFVGPGKGGVVRSAFDAVAPGGTLLLFTMTAPDEEIALPGHDLYFREVSLVPSYSCGPDDTREALELLASRRVAVADLVTHRFPVDAAPEAFARARDPNGSIKVVVTF